MTQMSTPCEPKKGQGNVATADKKLGGIQNKIMVNCCDHNDESFILDSEEHNAKYQTLPISTVEEGTPQPPLIDRLKSHFVTHPHRWYTARELKDRFTAFPLESADHLDQVLWQMADTGVLVAYFQDGMLCQYKLAVADAEHATEGRDEGR